MEILWFSRSKLGGPSGEGSRQTSLQTSKLLNIICARVKSERLSSAVVVISLSFVFPCVNHSVKCPKQRDYSTLHWSKEQRHSLNRTELDVTLCVYSSRRSGSATAPVAAVSGGCVPLPSPRSPRLSPHNPQQIFFVSSWWREWQKWHTELFLCDELVKPRRPRCCTSAADVKFGLPV